MKISIITCFHFWALYNRCAREMCALDTTDSVEITNKMQPCNRIYYSKINWRLNMFRMAYRSSSGALTVFTASGLHMHMVTGRSQVWVGTESYYNARIYEHSIYYLQCTDLWTFNLLSTSTTYFDKNSRFWEQNNRIIFGKILEEVTWWAIKIYNKGFQNFLYQNLLQWLNG